MSASVASPSQHLCVLHGFMPTRASFSRTSARTWEDFGLPRIRNSLHLFSLVLSDDSKMLHHWLKHYHGLGVRANHTNVAVRVRSHERGLNATLQTLHDARVPRENIRLIRASPADALKLQLINSFMDSLPRRSWVIYADVDELFDYPCGQPLWHHTCVAGSMVDQMAPDARITELIADGDIRVQYPLQCRIRARIPRQKFTKVILVNVGSGRYETVSGKGLSMSQGGASRRFRDTHAVNGTCTLSGIVRHYSMTTHQMAGLAEKAVQLPSKKTALNFAGGTCGNVNSMGMCMDYVNLHRWMQQRVTKGTGKGTSTKGCSRAFLSSWSTTLNEFVMGNRSAE